MFPVLDFEHEQILRTGHPTNRGGATVGRKIWKMLRSVFRNTISIVVFLTLWEVCARLHFIINPLFLPPFSTVVGTLGQIAVSGELWSNAAISLQRALIGYTAGILFAVPLGLAIGWFRGFEQIVNPLLQVFRNLPVLAMLPVFITFFGIGEFSKVFVVFWGVLWSVLLNTIAGVRSVDPQLVRASRSMGTSPVRLFRTVVVPASLPHIFTGMRLSATTSVLILIAAEMLGASSGLGYALTFYQANMKFPQTYAYIIVMAIIGVSLNFILQRIEKHTFRWRDESGTTIEAG